MPETDPHSRWLSDVAVVATGGGSVFASIAGVLGAGFLTTVLFTAVGIAVGYWVVIRERQQRA